MNSLNVSIFILLVIGGLKPALFWTYLWQLKEYRLDRFWADYGQIKKLFLFYLFSGGRKTYQPHWTIKSGLIFLLSLVSLLFIDLIVPIKTDGALLLGEFIISYFLAPILVSFWVFVFRWPSILVKNIIISSARRKISRLDDLLVIGITGSYGKTSTKEILAQLLAQKFKTIATPGNINTEIGLAKFISKTNFQGKSVFIVEMGAYRIGEIKKICRIVQPKIGILTGLCEQHLALFGSLKKIKQAKMELINSLPADGLAVFNQDDENVADMMKKWNGKKIGYSANQVQELNFSWPSYYRTNLAGAVAVAKYLGMNQEEIQSATDKIEPTSQIVQIKKGRSGAMIIDSSYNANPVSVLANLNYLKSEFPNGQRIVILPCLIELGDKSADIHYQIGQKIAQTCQRAIIVKLECLMDIRRGADSKNFPSEKIILVKNLSQLSKALENSLSSQTAILIAGRIPKEIKSYLLND